MRLFTRIETLTIASLLFACGNGRAAEKVAISSVVLSSFSGITITGAGFGTATPKVVLAGESLTVVSSSSTVIVASLPTALQTAGTYELVVTNESGTTPASGTFNATIPPLTINGLVNSSGEVIGSNSFGYTVSHLSTGAYQVVFPPTWCNGAHMLVPTVTPYNDNNTESGPVQPTLFDISDCSFIVDMFFAGTTSAKDHGFAFRAALEQ